MSTRICCLAFLLGVLSFHGADVAHAAERKSLAEEIDELSKLIAAGSNKVDETAKRIAKRPDAGFDTVMGLFKLRRKGGLGVGPTDKPLKPDGIEQFLLALERKDVYKAEMQKPLLEASYRVAAVLVVIGQFKNPFPHGHEKLYRKLTTDARKAAGHLTDSLNQGKPSTVLTAAKRLNVACVKCHAEAGPADPRKLALDLLKEYKEGKLDEEFLAKLDRFRRAAPTERLFGGPVDTPEKYAQLEDLLIQLVVHGNPEIREQSRATLVFLGLEEKKSPAVLRPQLESLPEQDRFRLMREFRGLTDEEAIVKKLGQLIKEQRYVLHLLPVIAALDARATIPEVRQLLKHDNFQVRTAARQTLAKLGGLEEVSSLIAALRSQDAIIRGRASLALAQKGRAAVEPLRAVLKEKDRAVRCSAMHALGAIGKEAKAAVPDLIALQNDKDELVQFTARLALQKIDPR